MAQRIPVDFVAEYRGVKPASTFKKDDREIAVPAKLKFEIQRGDDVENVEISGSALDRCVPPFDYSTLNRGELVRVEGVCVIQERGSDKDSFMSIAAVERVKPGVAAIPKAA